MKIILLHGDHTAKLFERYNSFLDEAKKRKWKIERIKKSLESA